MPTVPHEFIPFGLGYGELVLVLVVAGVVAVIVVAFVFIVAVVYVIDVESVRMKIVPTTKIRAINFRLS